MPEFEVQHSYASNHNGRRFGPWAEGDVIDLDATDADWVNRDSPDTLAEVGCAVELEEQTAEPGESLPDLPESAYPADAVELEEQTAEPGESLPDLPESAYPADAVELEEQTSGVTSPAPDVEPVVEAKPPVKRRGRS